MIQDIFKKKLWVELGFLASQTSTFMGMLNIILNTVQINGRTFRSITMDLLDNTEYFYELCQLTDIFRVIDDKGDHL